MRKAILSLLFVLCTLLSFGQSKVTWNYLYNPVSEEVQITADIAEGWHLYSQHIDNELGPIPTGFSFQENPDVQWIGKTIEPESIKEYDPNFEGELNFFKDKVTFVQKVKLKRPTTIVGTVTFMVCNDVMCLPPVDEEFIIEIN